MTQNKEFNCPICMAGTLAEFDPKSYSKCGNCKIVFQNPIPTESELAKLYENYYEFKDPSANVGYENYEENRSPEIFKKNYIPWIEKFVENKSSKFLDFGCGTGNLALAIKDAGYVSAEGCEFAADAFPQLRKKNINSFICSELSNINKKYNVVTMVDVIEHLRAPDADLRAIYNSLEDNGLLFIETINIDDFMVKNFHKEKWFGIAPAHTFLWGINSLKYALNKQGFKILEVKTYRICGSAIKWLILQILGRKLPYQFTFGDGVRVVAKKYKK